MPTMLDHPLMERMALAFGRRRLLPVRVRHWPYNFLDGFRQRTLAGSRPPARVGLHFVGFTCKQHFPLLECALESLTLLGCPFVKSISIFADRDDFPDSAQVGNLLALSPLIRLEQSPRFTGWGAGSVRLQFQTFSRIAAMMDEGDYLVKIDSDLLFISDWILHAALNSRADLIGDGRYVDFGFAQGGCFFLSRPMASCLGPYSEQGAIEAIFPEPSYPAEEQVLREVLRREGGRTWLTRFMMFPDEIRRSIKRAGGLVDREKVRYCVLHFVKGKETMPQVYRDLVLPALQGRQAILQ